jgi:Domain of unknown function DUF29
MATRIKSRADNLYEQDLYAWSRAQADLLRAARFAELDLEHLLEEIEDVGWWFEAFGAQPDARHHRAPAQAGAFTAAEPRAGWRATMRSQRIGLREVLIPTLRRESESELAALCEDARALADGALRDHGEDAAADALPETCPYSLDQIASDRLPR